jgi:leucyl-tRNA synthetase
MGNNESIAKACWPEFDPEVAKAEEKEIVIQVNGKLRGKIMVSADASEEQIKERALSCEQIQQWIEGKKIKKIIMVPGKLVSVVVKG